uniref:Uncharacterized protein n=1 Tax=Ailuropoda melanoleuca TaxID=9646 RepID=A0A7N5JJR8_AILME
MLLLLHEKDKMAPEWLHPEVNNNNIRLSSEAILSGVISFCAVTPFSRLQDGLPKGLNAMQFLEWNNLHGVLV